MTLIRWGKAFAYAVLFMLGFSANAEQATDLQSSFLPPESTHVSWVFSGVVTSEHGDSYGYLFQMQRDNDTLHSIAALFDGQSKKLVWLDEESASVQGPLTYNWRVGRAFLRFNPINDSWIFGLKSKDKQGFNFKVDMLTQPETAPVAQVLRPGVELLVNQTSYLNGHIQLGQGTPEAFVTAKNAWFRQIWLAPSEQEQHHPFTGVLCRFDDGSGFYSVNMTEPDALRGAVAGWSDIRGASSMMSQFISVKQAQDGPWHIRVASPSLHLILSDFVAQDSIIAGFVTEGKQPGFCVLSRSVIGTSRSLFA